LTKTFVAKSSHCDIWLITPELQLIETVQIWHVSQGAGSVEI